MAHTGREYYDDGMNRVFAHIDDHLSEDLSLSALSRISGYSEYHFHRIFHALTGTTLRAYVLDRRINAAATRLMYDAATVTRIAMDCGFSSSSSFVRAFRRATGCTASQYRRNRERRRPVGAAAHIPRYPPDPAADALFSAVTLPDLHVAGIACKGLSKHFRGADIERAFHRLFAWLADKRTPDGRTPVVGITLDTPEVVSFAECRYFACVPVGEGVRSEGCVSVRTFPTAGPYLQFSLDRNRPDFPEAFFRLTDYLYGHYMPEAGCYPDNRPFVEFYARENDTVVIRFCVPVRWQEMKRKERRAGVSSR